ncbi:MAG: hypothetical protein LBC61_04815 [Candidatus Peribacteria bacterium]|jgi:hypothetical protein|nr:hypothetical protein [Candidatus Peribacteria bacterium]
MPASEHKTNIEKYLKENKDTPSKDITTSLGSSDNDTYTKRIVMAFELSTKVNEDEKLGVAKNYFKEILVNTKANEIKDESLKRKIELFVINNISNNENYKIASDTDPISYLFDTEDYNSLNDELKIIY